MLCRSYIRVPGPSLDELRIEVASCGKDNNGNYPHMYMQIDRQIAATSCSCAAAVGVALTPSTTGQRCRVQASPIIPGLRKPDPKGFTSCAFRIQHGLSEGRILGAELKKLSEMLVVVSGF